MKEINAVKETLLFIKSDQVVPAIHNALDEMPPTSKAALYEVLASRDPDGSHDLAIQESGNPEKEIRMAAYAALATLATPTDGDYDIFRYPPHDSMKFHIYKNRLIEVNE